MTSDFYNEFRGFIVASPVVVLDMINVNLFSDMTCLELLAKGVSLDVNAIPMQYKSLTNNL